MKLFLEIVSHGRSYPPLALGEGAVLVGRSPECDIVLADPHVSRQQFTLECTRGRCRLVERGSKNPVRVNGAVRADGELEPGDRIEVGETALILRRGMIDSAGEGGSAIAVVDGDVAEELQRITLTAETIADVIPAGERGSTVARKVEAFQRLAEGLAGSADPDELFERVLSCLFSALPAERGFLALGEPGSRQFQAVKVRSTRADEDCTIEMSQTILDEIQLERKALLVQDAPGELAHDGARSIIRLGIRSFLCAPLLADDAVLGLIYLDQGAAARPFSEDDLAFLRGIARICGLAIDNVRVREQLERENRSLRGILERRNQLIGKSPVMVEVLRRVQKIATRDAPVLILGQTGTGKELVARAIHDQSDRKRGPFVAFNCALSNPSLIESELFGHVRGAFTDASRDHKGKFELASGGTLFLDEIGDMPLETQVKILRVIQERRVEPVGGERSVEVDIRLISATHRDLVRMREEKRFRDDLYYRLAVLTLELPPLAERGDDILELARALLAASGEELELDAAAGRALREYSWPGNVRELQNVVEQAAFNASGGRIRLQDLPPEVARMGRRTRLQVPLPSLSELEAKHIRKTLKACQGNKKRTAEVLGISRETLYKKLELYGI